MVGGIIDLIDTIDEKDGQINNMTKQLNKYVIENINKDNHINLLYDRIKNLDNDINKQDYVISQINKTLTYKQFELETAQTELNKYLNNDVKLNKMTRKELKEFLKKDKTNNLKYSDDFDCNAFSFTLIRNLYDYGYLAYPVYIEYDDSAHMVVSVYDENEELIYIEPQNDDIINIELGEYYGDGKIEEINSIEGVFVE
jgi:uncharacterized coiled-coil protein SlyX